MTEFKYIRFDEKIAEDGTYTCKDYMDYELRYQLKRIADTLANMDIGGLITAIERLQK